MRLPCEQYNVSGRNENFITGSAGAIAESGLGELKTREQIIAGELKPGAAIQVFTANTIEESINNLGYGHSFIFLNYNYNEDGNIIGMNVADQGFLNGTNVSFENYQTINGANLGVIEKRIIRVSFK